MTAPLPRLVAITALSSSDTLQKPEPRGRQPTQDPAAVSKESPRPDDSTPEVILRKNRNQRGCKKKRARRQSFAASTEDGSGLPETPQSHRQVYTQSAARASFYRLQGRDLSNTSIESEALLDHR
jgi:magnesium transporter